MSGTLAFMEDARGSEPMSYCRGVRGFRTYLMNGVEVVICPFDRAHIMLAKRMQYHLRKCIKQHRGEKVVCPYNATEYVNAEDFETHLALCLSRSRIVVNDWNSAKNRMNNNVVAGPPVDRSIPYDIEEYW